MALHVRRGEEAPRQAREFGEFVRQLEWAEAYVVAALNVGTVDHDLLREVDRVLRQLRALRQQMQELRVVR